MILFCSTVSYQVIRFFPSLKFSLDVLLRYFLSNNQFFSPVKPGPQKKKKTSYILSILLYNFFQIIFLRVFYFIKMTSILIFHVQKFDRVLKIISSCLLLLSLVHFLL
uniref:Uncharacterized protein n=1 Tax=Sipha flava TaxID=143950 RepID=A0A2S2R060_9HEMI